MRLLRGTVWVLGALVLELPGSPLAAQCPDGSPPPCSRPTAKSPAPNSVAVLYLDNLSRDTADAFLADGLTEEIIIRLGQVKRLAVKSRFEVQRFRGKSSGQDPQAIGRALNSTYLLSGSVQRGGNRVRLRVELVRAATRSRLWGDVIDTASTDLLTVESEIARAVTTAITGQLLPDERSRLDRPVTRDHVAYEEYLRGLWLVHDNFDETSQRNAIQHFNRAIARDSSFADAFAGLATAWEGLADGFVSPIEGYTRAKEASVQAIARDSTQASAYATLASAVIALDRDARESERLVRRAITLNPYDSWSYCNLSDALIAQGRIDEAIAAARRAWETDSLYSTNGARYSQELILAGRLDSAAALLPRLRAVMPKSDVDPIEGSLRAARGDWRAALPLLSWRYYGGSFAGTYVRALLALGDTVRARATVDSMVAARTPGYYNPLAIARAYTALGDLDRGMEWLRKAFDERTLWIVLVRLDRELTPLRADPRYQALDQQLRY